MPITQARLLRILEAAEQFEVLFDHAANQLEYEIRIAKKGEQTFEQALGNLSLHMVTMATRGARIVIAEERMHYKLTHKKNAWDARRKAHDRANFGTAVAIAAASVTAEPIRTAADVAAEVDAEEEALSEIEPPPVTMADHELTQMERDVQDGLAFAEQWKKEKVEKGK